MKILLIILFAVSSAVISFVHGSRVTPFVRPWSTTTRIESYPFDEGRPVMKSIKIWEKGRVFFGPSIGSSIGFVGCRLILYC